MRGPGRSSHFQGRQCGVAPWCEVAAKCSWQSARTVRLSIQLVCKNLELINFG